jgi:DNA-damage-inducible protein J
MIRAYSSLIRPTQVYAISDELRVKAAEHDASFRAAIQKALDDPRPPVPHAEVNAHFAKLGSDALSPRPAYKKLNF